MTDTPEALEARIEELEEQLQASESQRGISQQGSLQVLEKTIADKEVLESNVKQYAQILADLQLKTEVELLERDIEIATLRAELSKSGRLRDEVDEKDSKIVELNQQVREFKKGFEELKKVCVKNAVDSKTSEGHLEVQLQRNRDLEMHLIETQFMLREHQSSLTSFQQMAAIDEELLSQSMALETQLRANLDAQTKELNTFKDAFQQLSKIVVQSESERASEVATLKERNQKLEETVKQNAAMLAPRWQILANEKSNNKIGSKAAAVLKFSDSQISSHMSRIERQFLTACIPPEVWAVEIHVNHVGLALARLTFKADNFLDYIFEAHYKELAADAEENPLSVKKDKGFIRWLHQAVSYVAVIMSKTSIALEALRHASFADVLSFLEIESNGQQDKPKEGDTGGKASRWAVTTAESPLLKYLKDGETQMDRLLDSAENDYLSSAIDLGTFQSLIARLDSVASLRKTEHLPVPFTAIFKLADSEEFGILPPHVSSIARRLGSLAVLGLCNAAYTESAGTAISADVWNGLWQAALHVVERLPFGRRSPASFQSECLYSGFGLLKMPKRATDRSVSETFITKGNEAMEKIQAELCSTSEHPVTEIVTRLNKELPKVGSWFEKVDAMCHSFAPPQKSETQLTPWEEAVDVVLARVCGVTEVEQSFAHLQRKNERTEQDLQKAAQDIRGARQESHEWRAKFSELQLKAERLSLFEPELRELRANDLHYSSLIGTQRVQIDKLERIRKTEKAERDLLAARFDEATAVLEATKRLPRHQNQSEWDSLEIVNLRAINTKLEREILELQLQGAEKELEPSDLCGYLRHCDDAKQPGATISTNNHRVTVKRLVDEYRNLRSTITTHLLQIPLVRPSDSAQDTSRAMEEYISQHAALRMKLTVLQTKTNQLCGDVLGPSSNTSLFGSSACVPVQRFFKAVNSASQQKPVVKITVPHSPWPPTSSSVCNLQATSSQLAQLHKRLLGI